MDDRAVHSLFVTVGLVCLKRIKFAQRRKTVRHPQPYNAENHRKCFLKASGMSSGVCGHVAGLLKGDE